jgi:hypothetical protein
MEHVQMFSPAGSLTLAIRTMSTQQQPLSSSSDGCWYKGMARSGVMLRNGATCWDKHLIPPAI